MKRSGNVSPLSPLATRIPRSAIFFITSLALLMMTTACGKKGPIRPKLATLPAPAEEVTLQQQGETFLLGWTISSASLGDIDTVDLAGFRIRRLSYDAADGCPTCRDPQIEVAEIDINSPTPGERIGSRLYWRDLDIRLDMGYRYAIAPLTLGGQEGLATKVHLTAQQPPPSPTALEVKAGDAQVAVQWAEPALLPGMELVGYNLYRRQAKRLFSIVPVNPEPLQATSLLDRGLDQGRAYEYRVSSVVRIAGQLVESVASPGAIITPQ